tara:strand:- start:842 stop:1117 length:276 start_codon:yes stop_codon:yes gene_type:complete
MGKTIKISKDLKNRLLKKFDSIQEKYPHHTVFCPETKYLFTRRTKISRSCPKTGKKFKKILMVREFWVKKDKLIINDNPKVNLEQRRKKIK